jgi:hypothetical protein
MPTPEDLLHAVANAGITVHHGGPTWAEVVAGDHRSAFMIDADDDELLETVEFTTVSSRHGPPGSPDWSEAGTCDPIRGSDGDLQRLIREKLES